MQGPGGLFSVFGWGPSEWLVSRQQIAQSAGLGHSIFFLFLSSSKACGVANSPSRQQPALCRLHRAVP